MIIWSINWVPTRLLLIFCYFFVNILFCFRFFQPFMPGFILVSLLNSTLWLFAPSTSRFYHLILFPFVSIITTITYEENKFALIWAYIISNIRIMRFIFHAREVFLNIFKVIKLFRISLTDKVMIRHMLQRKVSFIFMIKELRRLRTAHFCKWISQNKYRTYQNELVFIFIFEIYSLRMHFKDSPVCKVLNKMSD